SVFAIGLPSGTLHVVIVLSAAAHASFVLSGENLSARIAAFAAGKVVTGLPSRESKIFTLPSSQPVANHLPSELTASVVPASAALSFCTSAARRHSFTSR